MIDNSVVIHQPHFLPWLPYFGRLASSSVFTVLDNVEYSKEYYQDRTKIIDHHGTERWITIPTTGSSTQNIKDVKIDSKRFYSKARKTIKQNYSQSNYFERVWRYIRPVFEKPSEWLLDLNMRSIECINNALSVNDVEIVLASDITESDDVNKRIIEVCDHLEVNKVLVGWGSSLDVHNLKLLKNNNVYFVPLERPLFFEEIKNVREGISIIDEMFSNGIKKTKRNVINTEKIYRKKIHNINGI